MVGLNPNATVFQTKTDQWDGVNVNGKSSITLGAVMIIYWLDLQLPVQSVPIATKVVSSNLVNGEMYSIQHYVKKFVSGLRQVGGYLRVLRFPPPIKFTSTI